MILIRRYNIWLSKLAMPVSAAALAWAFALSALSRMPAAFVRSTRVPASIAAPAPVPAPLAPFPRLDFKPRQHGKRYAPLRMHSVFFIPPAGRRRPGRSPAALRAASADCRPLRRAERPSGLRPASPPPACGTSVTLAPAASSGQYISRPFWPQNAGGSPSLPRP